MMYMPIYYRIEMVNKELLHAVYTCNLSPEDAAKLKSNMTRKSKINLAVLLFGVAMFLIGLVLPWILYLVDEAAATALVEKYPSSPLWMILVGCGGILIFLFALNKCVGVAGSYLKALKIAYPHLPPHVRQKGESKDYHIWGTYNPKEYRTGKRNKALMAELESGSVDEARVQGLLNYAIAGRSQGHRMMIFAFLFGTLMLAVWACLYVPSVQILDGSADELMYMILGGGGSLMILGGFRWIYIFKTNSEYIRRIKAGYSRFSEK